MTRQYANCVKLDMLYKMKYSPQFTQKPTLPVDAHPVVHQMHTHILIF